MAADPRPAFLYVLEFGPEIKVGRTIRPDQRAAEHRNLARFRRLPEGRRWLSPSGCGSRANESALIDWCAERGTRVSGREVGEWFTGLDFDQVVHRAAALRPHEDRAPDLADIDLAVCQLLDALEQARHLPPIERARLYQHGGPLRTAVVHTLGACADAEVAALVHATTWQKVARDLGVGVSTIGQAVRRHRLRAQASA